MCYWLTNACPIEGEQKKAMTITCPNADGAGYCEMEKTGPGIGSGKYLFPVHKSLYRIAPCEEHAKIYANEGKWKKKDGTELELGWLKPGFSVIVDPTAHMVTEMIALRKIFEDTYTSAP